MNNLAATIFLICSFALLNYCRGQSILKWRGISAGKGGTSLLKALCVALVLPSLSFMPTFAPSGVVLPFGVLLWLGIWAWAAPGWGLYFSSMHGLWLRTESNIRWIESIGYWLYPFKTAFDSATNIKRGIVCFAFRGSFILAAFLPLALLLESPWVLALGILAGAPQGLIYSATRWRGLFKTYGNAPAELLHGAWLGFCFSLAVSGGI